MVQVLQETVSYFPAARASLIHSSPKLETAQMSCRWHTNKQAIVNPYSGGILYSNSSEQTTDTRNRDRGQELYAM